MLDDRERTELATPKRREEARKRGQVAYSQELISALALLAGFGLIQYLGPMIGKGIKEIATLTFSAQAFELSSSNVYLYFLTFLPQISKILAPLMFGVLFVSLLGNIAQVGFWANAEILSPSFDRINPLKGLLRLISRQAIFELVKAIIKIAIIGYIAYSTIKNQFANFQWMADMSVGAILKDVSDTTMKVGFRIIFALLALSILDYGWKRWEYEQSLKMTKEEVKEELKETEAHPQIKMRIKGKQRELTMHRMMQSVPKSDVVITNPHTLAVALSYSREEERAPKVVAKGARLIAEKIKEIARNHNVPIVEDKPLAFVLYKTVKIGQEIPPTLYKAVAEILAYVYKLKGAN